MIKCVMPLRRKPGMSTGAFRDYYENHHRLIGEKYLKGYASRYVRRYLDPLPDREGKLCEPEFDVILEVWYPDLATQQACSDHLGQPEIAQEIVRDEEKLFDCSRMRSYLLTEHESSVD